MKKTNNKGFSLVELIVVIAIMAVLVGVAAPTFTKYVEQARRSTDVQNAEAIKTAVLADIADGTLEDSKSDVVVTDADGGYHPTALTEVPVIQAKGAKGNNFTATWNVTNGTCSVEAGGVDLTDPDTAEKYKSGEVSPTASSSGSGTGGGEG